MKKKVFAGIRVLLGMVLIFACITKVSSPSEFLQFIKLFGVTGEFAHLVMAAVILVEAILGGNLVTGLNARISCRIAAVMFAFFLAIISYAYSIKATVSCGCFGGVFDERIGLAVVIRNIFLFVSSVALAFQKEHSFTIEGFLRK